MANLWRTQRPRFPHYQSDGFGRDYYIKYTNGGYWENQFTLTKKPDYERPHYKNFHSLYHLAAPFKYWGDGSGRENYILKCNGFHHDQKPLCSYQLTDFLRTNLNSNKTPSNFRRKVYYSVSENKYFQKLRNLEKKLVKRLYTEPMKMRKKKRLQIFAEDKDFIDNNNKTSINNPNINTIGASIGVNSDRSNGKKCTRNKTDFEIQKNVEEENIAKYYGTVKASKNKERFGLINSKNHNNIITAETMSNNPYRCKRKIILNNSNNEFNNYNNVKNNNNTYYGNFANKKGLTLKMDDISSMNNNLKCSHCDSRGKNNKTVEFKKPTKINEKLLNQKIIII